MSEEFDTGVDTADTAPSADVDSSDVGNDMSTDIPDDIPEDIPAEEPDPAGDGIPDDIPEDVPTNESEPLEDSEPTEDSLPEDVSESESASSDEKTPEGIAEDIPEDTDWERTSLRPEDEAILKEMDENGELDIPEENPDLEDPTHSELHLPTEKTGEFLGDDGNSEFRPNSEEALERMSRYGRDTVDYQNGYPNFEPFTSHDSEWGPLNGQVEIPHMTPDRENGSWEMGRRPTGTGHDPNYDIGNFAQADNAVAEQFRATHPDIRGEDIEKYRKDNHLTWHECADGKTMQLVPEEIHSACRHSGGVSEMKYRMAWGDVTRPIDD